MRGYSHIFINGPADDGSSLGDQEPVTDIVNGLQETFSREGLRQLIKAYESGVKLSTVRHALGGEHPWDTPTFRNPAPRVDWTSAIPTEPKTRLPTKVIAHNYDDDDDDEAGGDEGGMPVSDGPPSPSPTPSTAAPHAPAPPSDIDETTADAAGTPSSGSEVVDPTPAPMPRSSAADLSFEALVQANAEKSKEDSAEEHAWLDATAQKLRSALLGYSLQAKIVGTRLTPNAALVRFMGSDRLRVEDIEARQSALLTTHGLRLISVSPLPGEIVVGVARPQRQVVSLWDVWARRELNRNPTGVNTSFVLGLKELDGDILYLNLGGAFAGGQPHEPHTLIAGATGSGKSVLIQALLLDIAATNPSTLTHIHLIDPKMGVDYAAVERLPHLQGGVIVDQIRAVEVMEGLGRRDGAPIRALPHPRRARHSLLQYQGRQGPGVFR